MRVGLYPKSLRGLREEPRKWCPRRKWTVGCITCSAEFIISFASSDYSSSQNGLVDEFGCAALVGRLGISLFIVGYAVGGIVFSPFSETFGRNVVYLTSLVSMVFSFACHDNAADAF